MPYIFTQISRIRGDVFEPEMRHATPRSRATAGGVACRLLSKHERTVSSL
jgi:hypothetical protein